MKSKLLEYLNLKNLRIFFSIYNLIFKLYTMKKIQQIFIFSIL